jgi:hypothetical protein
VTKAGHQGAWAEDNVWGQVTVSPNEYISHLTIGVSTTRGTRKAKEEGSFTLWAYTAVRALGPEKAKAAEEASWYEEK